MSLRGLLANKLGRLVTLEKPTQVIVNGEATDGWPVQGEEEMLMEWLSGTDGSGLVAEATYRFTGIWRGDLAITPTWRLGLKDTTRKFQITAFGDPDGRERMMVITAKEIL